MRFTRLSNLLALPFVIVGTCVSSAQDSPSSLPIGSLLQYSGNAGDEAFMITGGSTFESEGIPGSHTFEKTGISTSNVSYTLQDEDDEETETAILSLTFTSNSSGTYTIVGTITGSDGTRTLTGYGTFVLVLPKSSEVPAIADDFNDNSQNTSIWGTDLPSTGSGTLTETNQRLEYTASASAPSSIYRSWNHDGQIHYERDWEMAIDISSTISDGAVNSGLAVFHPWNNSRYVEASLYGWADPGAGRNGRRIETGPGADSTEISTLSPTASLRISYSSDERRINCYADFDGPANGYEWRAVGSYSVGTWGMSGSQPFRVVVFGKSWNPVPVGSAYLDNFRISSAQESTLDAWKRLQFGDPASADAADLHDYDDDGITNLMEYACGLAPKSNGIPILVTGTGTNGLPHIFTTESSGLRRLRIEFVRRTAASAPGITYIPQFCDSLSVTGEGSWQAATGTEVVTPINTPDGSWERVVIEDTATDSPSRFGRVKVSKP